MLLKQTICLPMYRIPYTAGIYFDTEPSNTNKNIKQGRSYLHSPAIMIAHPQKLIKPDFIVYPFLIKR